MSADFKTKDFAGYAHKNFVSVFWKDCDVHVVDLTPDIVRQLQSIIDQWKSTEGVYRDI